MYSAAPAAPLQAFFFFIVCLGDGGADKKKVKRLRELRRHGVVQMTAEKAVTATVALTALLAVVLRRKKQKR
jgi:hypothetical protein